jgi:hypothetical protein
MAGIKKYTTVVVTTTLVIDSVSGERMMILSIPVYVLIGLSQGADYFD